MATAKAILNARQGQTNGMSLRLSLGRRIKGRKEERGAKAEREREEAAMEVPMECVAIRRMKGYATNSRKQASVASDRIASTSMSPIPPTSGSRKLKRNLLSSCCEGIEKRSERES